jgi:hypothetical protein
MPSACCVYPESNYRYTQVPFLSDNIQLVFGTGTDALTFKAVGMFLGLRCAYQKSFSTTILPPLLGIASNARSVRWHRSELADIPRMLSTASLKRATVSSLSP